MCMCSEARINTKQLMSYENLYEAIRFEKVEIKFRIPESVQRLSFESWLIPRLKRMTELRKLTKLI